MQISHRSKFLLIHIQRTGGGSVARALKPWIDHPKAGRAAKVASLLPFTRDPRQLFFGAHIKAREVKLRWPRKAWEEYFKFCFVRNPYSWLVSLYSRIGSSPEHRQFNRVSTMSFPEYVDWELARNRRHQHHFVCDRAGQVILDFVGRLESLDADVATVFRRLGLEAPAAIPKLGGRQHAPWQSFYDNATRAKVAAHWSRDLELFGYDFEGPRTDLHAAVGMLAGK